MITGSHPNRRELLMLVAAAGLLPASGLPASGLAASGLRAGAADGSQTGPARPSAIGPSDGELVFVGRDPVRIKVGPPGGQGRFGMITQEVSAGTSIPVHLHEREDEIIFIQSGRGEATLGEDRVMLEAGSALFVPQGTWHGGRNTGSGVLQWIAIYSPSGFERYFREIGRRSLDESQRTLTAEERQARDDRFGIRYR